MLFVKLTTFLFWNQAYCFV